MMLGQRIVRDETLLFDAKVTVALIGADGRPRRFPQTLATAFKVLQTKLE